MQKKIRNAQKQKVPYMLIAGDDDVASGAVSFRYRDGEQKNGVPVDEAVAEIVDAVASRSPGASRGAEESSRFGCRRLRAAVDAAPDGLHPGENKPVARRGRRRVPVLPCAADADDDERL